MSENNSNSEQLKGPRNPDGTCGRGWTGDDCNIPCCKGICDPPQGPKKLCEENERDYGGKTCIYDETLKKCIQPCPQDKEKCQDKDGCFWTTWKSENTDKNVSACRPTVCNCLHGVGGVGTGCPDDGKNVCTRCFNGYKLESHPEGKTDERYKDLKICKCVWWMCILIWVKDLTKYNWLKEYYFGKSSGVLRILTGIMILLSSVMTIIFIFSLLTTLKNRSIPGLYNLYLFITIIGLYTVGMLLNNFLAPVIDGVDIIKSAITGKDRSNESGITNLIALYTYLFLLWPFIPIFIILFLIFLIIGTKSSPQPLVRSRRNALSNIYQPNMENIIPQQNN